MKYWNTLLLGLLSFNCLAEIVLSGASVRLLPPGVPNTAGYLTVNNRGDTERVLIGASAEFVERIELHQHVMENDLMKMVKQEQIKVAAGESVLFQPGGYHLMMFGVKEPLKENQKLEIQLQFANGEQLRTVAQVKSSITSHHHH